MLWAVGDLRWGPWGRKMLIPLAQTFFREPSLTDTGLLAACSGDGDVKPGCTSLGWAGRREGRASPNSFAQYHPSTHRVPVSQALGKHPKLNGLKNGGGMKRERREGVSIVGAGVGGRLQWWGRGCPGRGNREGKGLQAGAHLMYLRNSRMAGVSAADQG